MPLFKTDKSKKTYALRDKKQRLKRNKPDSESDDESCVEEDMEESEYETLSETDSTYSPSDNKKSSDDEEDQDIDKTEFRKTLSKIFPSKYMSKKVKNDEKNKKSASKSNDKKKSKRIESDSEEDEVPKKSKKSSAKTTDKKKGKRIIESDSEEDEVPKKSKKSAKSNDKKKAKRIVESDDDSEDDDEETLGSEDSYTDDDEEYDEDEEEKNINIVFSIGGGMEDDDYDEEYEDDDDEEDEESADESDDEKTFMKEKYEKVDLPKEDSPESEDESPRSKKSGKKSDKNSTKKKDKKKQPKEEEPDVETEYTELLELKKILSHKLHKKPNSKILKNALAECKESIKELIDNARAKNAKSYYKLIHSDRKKQSELDYFKTKLSNKEQLKIMKDLKEINACINIDKPYRLALLESKMPAKFKACAMQKLNVLRSMEPGESEYYKIKGWVDTFMKIPFGIHKSLSVKMDDGLDACHQFMGNAKQILDDCTYGLDDAKMQIMQMVGQWVANPSAMGTAIAIQGPPGTGKTTLVKEGISKILGREFAFLALGGAGDSSFLEGHSYTYEGSTWGKIVQILIDSKCMNPVIYFDELDKVSETPRGEEIIGILTHLTDTSQNQQFHDKYFSEVDFDISKCLFIFSYNDESKVNPILKDRMYRIQTKGYETKEKIIIARNHLLPKIREQVNFSEIDVIIPDDTIHYIASTEALTKGESGVRNLKRCLEIIYTKLNLFRLVKSDDNMFSKDIDLKVSFPFTVSRKDVDVFIKNDKTQNQSLLAMYV
jgi:ATP-dependent Lon protease